MCHTPALMRASAAWQCMARRMRVSWRRTGDDHRAVGLLVLLHEILRASGAAPPVKIRGASPHPRLASPLSSCRARRYMEGFGVTARLWSNSKTKHPQQDSTRSSSFPLLLVSTRAAPGPGRSMLCGAMWRCVALCGKAAVSYLHRQIAAPVNVATFEPLRADAQRRTQPRLEKEVRIDSHELPST